MSATTANAAEFQDGGKPVAQPYYLVDINGNPIGATGAQSLPVTVANGNANGQSTKANSAPVVLASDQWSPTSPDITESTLQNLIRNGQAFAVNGNGVTATNANLQMCALSLFNPSGSGKRMLVYSLNAFSGSSANTIGRLTLTTSDPGNTTGFTTQLTPTNLPGLTAPSTVASAWQTPTGATASVTVPGTMFQSHLLQSNVQLELISNGYPLPLAPGYGVTSIVFVAVTTNYFSTYAKWVEY